MYYHPHYVTVTSQSDIKFGTCILAHTHIESGWVFGAKLGSVSGVSSLPGSMWGMFNLLECGMLSHLSTSLASVCVCSFEECFRVAGTRQRNNKMAMSLQNLTCSEQWAERTGQSQLLSSHASLPAGDLHPPKATLLRAQRAKERSYWLFTS